MTAGRKPEFLSELDTRKIKGPVRAAVLLAPFGFYSAHLGREIWIPAGFVTDFASVPRFPLAYWLFGGLADREAVIHDFLYGKNMPEITRKQADEIFSEAMHANAEEVSDWKRRCMWFGVRMFGWNRWGKAEPQPNPPPVRAREIDVTG